MAPLTRTIVDAALRKEGRAAGLREAIDALHVELEITQASIALLKNSPLMQRNPPDSVLDLLATLVAKAEIWGAAIQAVEAIR